MLSAMEMTIRGYGAGLVCDGAMVKSTILEKVL